MLKRIGSIYKLTNLVTGKSYIGKTQRTVEERWKEHCKQSGCRRLSRSIKVHGKENFKVEEIYVAFDIQSLNDMEIHFISTINTISPNGYNLTIGGEGAVFCDESRKLLSDKLKGIDRSNLMKPVIRICVKTMIETEFPSLKSTSNDEDEQRSIRAVCNNERNNYTHNGFYWVYKEEYKDFSPPIYNRTNIEVVQFCIKTNTVIYHNSFQTLNDDNLTAREIKKCCESKRLCYKNSFWFYKNDFNLDIVEIKRKELSDPFKVLNVSPKTKGCYLHTKSGLYNAKITINHKKRSLGYFKTELEANNAYIKELSIKSQLYLAGEL